MESIYNLKARTNFNKNHSKSKPVVIVRDQSERLWSGYWFFHWYNHMSFTEFLGMQNEKYQNLGFNFPLKSCDWKKYLDPFYDLKPIIVKLDEMQKESGFPHDKVTIETKEPKMQSMPATDREKVYSFLKVRRLDRYGLRPD